MSATAILRARTSTSHDHVDAAFGAYSLQSDTSYLQFLLAHARALPTAETVLLREGGVPAWRPRTALLADDLAVFGSMMPTPLSIAIQLHSAFVWGVYYVLEGSRLGGKLLADRVRPGLPALYLRAAHEPGEWRTTRGAIDEQAAAGGDEWIEEAIVGAEACFQLYLRAAKASPA